LSQGETDYRCICRLCKRPFFSPDPGAKFCSILFNMKLLLEPTLQITTIQH
jgi:hypothetical protein